MTAHAFTDADPPSARPDLWDAQRLASLLADVGEAGLRDLLRLFMADVPSLQTQFAAAVAARDAYAATGMLALLLDSAEALGLSALAALARDLRAAPLEPDGPDRVALEVARIRVVPSLKHAS